MCARVAPAALAMGGSRAVCRRGRNQKSPGYAWIYAWPTISPLVAVEPHKFDAPLDHRPRYSHGFLRSQRHVLGLHRGIRRWHGHGPSRGARRVRARQVHGQASPGGACHNRARHRHPSPRGVPSLGPSGAPSRRSTSTADATHPNPRVFQNRSARTRAPPRNFISADPSPIAPVYPLSVPSSRRRPSRRLSPPRRPRARRARNRRADPYHAFV